MIRIVKLEFEPQYINNFIEIYKKVNEKILAMPGCNSVQLLQDKQNANVFFTYSNWNSETDLNNYRLSETFIQTWQTIKPWFAAKANAWSLQPL